MRIFSTGTGYQENWDDFCSASLSMELPKWFHNFPLLVEIVDKTTLPNSIFKFNTSF